jgi:hypothetical protein
LINFNNISMSNYGSPNYTFSQENSGHSPKCNVICIALNELYSSSNASVSTKNRSREVINKTCAYYYIGLTPHLLSLHRTIVLVPLRL